MAQFRLFFDQLTLLISTECLISSTFSSLSWIICWTSSSTLFICAWTSQQEIKPKLELESMGCQSVWWNEWWHQMVMENLTFFSWLSRSTGTMSWQRWSVSVHSTHTHLWSLLQNSSRSRWCLLHILFSSMATGSISLWILKVATLRWGSKWLSQYEVRHTRQDFRAFLCLPVHTSQHMHFPSAIDNMPFCLFFLICSDISLAKEFSQSSGRPSKMVSHLGQLMAGLSSQCDAMQVKQKLCPQGMETGSEKTSWQMQHWNWISDNRTLGEAMTSEIK